jgi:ribokinase
MPRITVLGSTNLDILYKQSKRHAAGETIIVKDAVICGGGKGANQAVQIARLGNIPRFVTAIGDDALGVSLREELTRYGIPLVDAIRKDTSSGIGIVAFLEDGSLTSTVVEGANGCIEQGDIESRIDAFRDCNFLVAQLELPVPVVERAISICAAAGGTVVLNVAPARPLSGKTLREIDVMIANEVEAGYYLGVDFSAGVSFDAAGLAFADRYELALVVTLGPMGSRFYADGVVTEIPPLDVPVVETTGAGDSYVGALVVALSEGRDIQDACRFANCAGSLTIQQIGGQRSMPDKDAVLSLYKQQYS